MKSFPNPTAEERQSEADDYLDYYLFRHQNLNDAERLIRSEANINYKNIKGNSYLIRAVEKGDVALIKFLLMHGIDRNIINSKGETALSLAKRTNNSAIIDILTKTEDQQK